MERILVIGAGLLGTSIVEAASSRYEVHAADMDSSVPEPDWNFHVMDITQKKAVDKLMTRLRPAAVFHTAAMTNVDRCEIEKELALQVNGISTGYIAHACAELNTYLCYISTDFVFNGEKGNYKETDPVKPVNVYGESKALGEKEVRRLGKHGTWSICRSSILYGTCRKRFNFATWIIGELKAGRPIRIVTDQTGSPTLADDLAEACLSLWERGQDGLFHVACREPISRYDFALRVCDVFRLEKKLVSPIRTEDLKQRATRPPDSSLDVSKVEAVLGRRMLDARGGLEAMKERWDKSIPGEYAPSSRTA